jgi:precorrin-2 dehydrogenase/sirohydrochlorin ferrochelatase
MAAFLYPVTLDVRGRRCVVVGGGPVGERKARALVEAGAEVSIVAPEMTGTLGELIQAGDAAHIEAAFTPQHLDGAFLVIAATNDPGINGAVAAAGRARGLLVNLAAPADVEDAGDFVTMASVRRGEMLLALTTGGAGPALAARLKRELEAMFGEEWGAYVALLREMRETVKRRYTREAERAEALRRLAASDGVRAKVAAGDLDGARAEALACLS